MKKFALMALLLSSPAHAQLQFDSQPAAATPPPAEVNVVDWLSRQPMTLMDIGLMELTRQASERMQALTGVNGAVAEYLPNGDIIRISLYPATPYQKEMCEKLGFSVREQIFPNYKEKSQLAAHLGTFFSNYGPQAAGRPSNVGEQLLVKTYLSVVMDGGGCAMPLDGEKMEHRAEAPTAPEPEKASEKLTDKPVKQPAKESKKQP